jgi:hypothetical protein
MALRRPILIHPARCTRSGAAPPRIPVPTVNSVQPCLRGSDDAPAALPPALDLVLRCADVALDGDRPWDLRFPAPDAIDTMIDVVIGAVLQRGSLGLGDTYGEGLWDCDDLDQLFTRLLLAQGVSQLARSRRFWRYYLLGCAGFFRSRQGQALAIGTQQG